MFILWFIKIQILNQITVFSFDFPKNCCCIKASLGKFVKTFFHLIFKWLTQNNLDANETIFF